MEYDPFEEGHVWITTLKSQTLSKVKIDAWSVEHVLDLPYGRAHGVVRVADGIWVVHTSDPRDRQARRGERSRVGSSCGARRRA